MKIAIAGTRGIPARYGGFETFAEELSWRLAARGHQVTVYGRHPLFSKAPACGDIRGVRTRSAPTIMHKYLETPLHALFTFLDLLRRDADVVLLCNAANSPMSWLSRLRPGRTLVTNVDGIERMRAKWNALGRAWYRLGEISAVAFSHRIVADAEVIARYYQEQYRVDSAVIRYGAAPVRRAAGEVCRELGIEADRYLLYVSRLEPENNALGVIEAYSAIDSPYPLVVVGDAPYADEYKAALRRAANERVIFAGFRFGEAYQELRGNCLLYIQATEVGGTHPALVEAMAYGNCIVANRVPEHEEVLGDCGEYYAKNDFSELSRVLSALLADAPRCRALGERAAERAREEYSWDRITDQYEQLFSALREG